SWEVRKGDAVAIMGPSGCGKTTLLNLLGGVDRPTTGRILIDGQDLTGMNERALEKHRLLRVGFVFQFFNRIPSITAVENLELPMVMAGVPESECHARAKTLLGLVGLEAKGQKRPEELSGGDQQRVAVALALANAPATDRGERRARREKEPPQSHRATDSGTPDMGATGPRSGPRNEQCGANTNA